MQAVRFLFFSDRACRRMRAGSGKRESRDLIVEFRRSLTLWQLHWQIGTKPI